MTKRRDWIKVRKDWWESPSHRLISPEARCFGVYLLYLADTDPEWREKGVGRLVAPDLTPLSLKNVSVLSGFSLKKVQKWAQELKRIGTLSETPDGVMFFLNYREHQENRSARSMRKAREDVHNGVHSDVHSEHDVNGEAEAEAEADTNPPTPRKRGKATSVMASVEDTKQVCAWIAQARQRAGIGKARPPAVTEQTRREVRKPMAKCGATLEDWSTVINRQVAACRGDIDSARKYLTLSTLHRPGNFTRLLERDDLDGQSQPGGDW